MVVQTLTYGIRLHPSPAESDLLDRTCTAYLSCCDHVSRVAKSNRTLSQRKLNDLAYRHLRETYHVGSQMAQSAIIRVIGNYRTVKESFGDPWKTKRPLQYTSSGYDLVWNRDYSIPVRRPAERQHPEKGASNSKSTGRACPNSTGMEGSAPHAC